MTLQLKSWWWHDEAMIDWPCSQDGAHLGLSTSDCWWRGVNVVLNCPACHHLSERTHSWQSWWWGRSWQLQTHNSWCSHNFRTAHSQLFLDQANQNVFNWTHFSAHYTEEERVRLNRFVSGPSIVPRICPTNLLGQQIFCYHCLEIIKRVSFRFHGLLRSHISYLFSWVGITMTGRSDNSSASNIILEIWNNKDWLSEGQARDNLQFTKKFWWKLMRLICFLVRGIYCHT